MRTGLGRSHLPLSAELDAYIFANNPSEPPELRELRERGLASPNRRWQASPEQAAFLALMVKISGAKRIIEVGTFMGYSAMAMALALPADGQLITCDIDAANVATGRRFWREAHVDGRIDARICPALATLAALAEEQPDSFDLAFIDGEKTEYDDYYELALQIVRPGGVMILDNMLRRGEVARSDLNDTTLQTIRALSRKIAKDSRIDHVLLSMGDGVTIVRRIA